MNILYQAEHSSYLRTTFLFLVLAELLSIFAWALPEFNLACFVVILLLTAVLSFKNIAYGIFIALAELIIGSYGYLFSLELGNTLVSLRMGIFMIVIFVWLVKLIQTRGVGQYLVKLKQFPFTKYYLYLAVILIWGFAWGLIRGNDFGNLFLDFNNWLFFLYLLPLIELAVPNPAVATLAIPPPASVSQNNHYLNNDLNNDFWPNFYSVALAALAWLIIKTLIFLYIFSHQFLWALPELYLWIRDTRVGEITMLANNFYRIFLQSQLFALLAFFIILPFLKLKIQKYSLLLLGCLATVVISFSRSFWAGLAAGLATYFLFLLIYQRKQLFKSSLNLITVAVVSFAIIFTIINLPPKVSGQSLASLISERTSQIEAAGSSRLNMLKPLVAAITKHPVIGSGFGTSLTYRSLDPRVLATTAGASGEYSTYAFEWAYLDLLLKVGLAGLAIYLLLIYKILRALWQPVKGKPQTSNLEINSNFKLPTSKLSLGLVLALVSLLALNIFTPYLNHPLGIGFILLASLLTESYRIRPFGRSPLKINPKS